VKIVAVVLIVAGVLALVYGGFTYKRETHDARIGPVEIEVTEKEQMDVPAWAGVALIVVGGGLLLTAKKR
jgi:hypothetical protein